MMICGNGIFCSHCKQEFLTGTPVVQFDGKPHHSYCATVAELATVKAKLAEAEADRDEANAAAAAMRKAIQQAITHVQSGWIASTSEVLRDALRTDAGRNVLAFVEAAKRLRCVVGYIRLADDQDHGELWKSMDAFDAAQKEAGL